MGIFHETKSQKEKKKNIIFTYEFVYTIYIQRVLFSTQTTLYYKHQNQGAMYKIIHKIDALMYKI